MSKGVLIFLIFIYLILGSIICESLIKKTHRANAALIELESEIDQNYNSNTPDIASAESISSNSETIQIEESKKDLAIEIPQQMADVSTLKGIDFAPEVFEKPDFVVIKSGDCLSRLASDFYGSSAEFSKIYEANSDILSSPHLIYPGQKLRIP